MTFIGMIINIRLINQGSICLPFVLILVQFLRNEINFESPSLTDVLFTSTLLESQSSENSTKILRYLA